MPEKSGAVSRTVFVALFYSNGLSFLDRSSTNAHGTKRTETSNMTGVSLAVYSVDLEVGLFEGLFSEYLVGVIQSIANKVVCLALAIIVRAIHLFTRLTAIDSDNHLIGLLEDLRDAAQEISRFHA